MTPDIEVSRRFLVDMSATHLWEVLTDPERLVACIPGAVITSTNQDGSLDGEMVVKLGPTNARFKGTATPILDDATRTGTLSASGSDQKGRTRVRAVAWFRVDDEEEVSRPSAGSHLELRATINAAGALAPFIRSSGPMIAEQLLTGFSTNVSTLAQGDPTADDDNAGTPLDGGRLLASWIAGSIRAALEWVRRFTGVGRDAGRRTG